MSQPNGEKVRLLLVEDQALVRESVARLLGAEPDLDVVARCGSVEEALQILSSTPVDLVLLDYALGPHERGSDLLPRAKQIGFQGKVLVVTASLSDPEAVHLLRQGIVGVFLKEGSPELLAKAIRKVMAGEIWLDQHYLQLLMQSETPQHDAAHSRLTAREIEVLRGVFEGLANKEIGTRLEISESSVKAALQQLFRKTGVNSRGQLVRVAMEKYADQL